MSVVEGRKPGEQTLYICNVCALKIYLPREAEFIPAGWFYYYPGFSQRPAASSHFCSAACVGLWQSLQAKEAS